MKASQLLKILHSIPLDQDPDVVTGEVWLPERLTRGNLHEGFLFLDFDNAPEEEQGEEEGRGFVEHEEAFIREQLNKILQEDSGQDEKTEALLAILLMAHEHTSSEFIEMLGTFNDAKEAP
ncbi:hypothetical protein [Vibrio palustris]|uniref:Uncharacterized protein n=1 Tax=Vibrio palustris TaxID=1918946 RepID=A0A1R4B2D0_9VIBR|nr:hypothetical protein [Vibrio palustris]SJL83068.1 hypothetical protein VPAL9027_01016 [Vibrio palustris]